MRGGEGGRGGGGGMDSISVDYSVWITFSDTYLQSINQPIYIYTYFELCGEFHQLDSVRSVL